MAARKTTILAADDDPQTLRLLQVGLQAAGYSLLLARDGLEALQKAETSTPDLLILDVKMPQLSGLEVCAQVRTCSTVPIMMLTAFGQIEDKKQAFDLGADDFLTKPFSLVELTVRVQALLRRVQWAESGSGRALQTKVTVGNLVVDFSQHQVSVDDRSVALTPIEYRILTYLLQHSDRIITYDLLLEHVWGQDYTGEDHLLKVNMNRLRRKIEADSAHPRYIRTKPGIGYMLHPSQEPGGEEQGEEKEGI